jgi:effector-binding domain-containing protein
VIESIEVRTLAEQPVAVMRGSARAEEIGEFVGSAYAEVLGTLAAYGLGPVGLPVIRYHQGAGATDGSGQAEVFELEAGFPCPPGFAGTASVTVTTLPEGPAVVAVHVGAWPELGEAYAAVETYLADNGLARAGDPWETYTDGPDVAVHRTILTLPCRTL